MKTSSHRDTASGFALIATVIMVSLLTIMAVALLISSGMDQTTARAVANKAKSDLAAKAAVDVAVARLVDNLMQYPDSATTWETINGNDGTVVYYRDKTPEVAAAGGPAAQLYVLPLISGATAQLAANKAASFPILNENDAPGVPANAFDLNHARFSGDAQGWIGAPPSALSRPPFRGQWIELKDSDNKVTSRYAYWMEDESFKANVNLLGNTKRGSNSLGQSPSEIPLEGVFKTALISSPDVVANDTFGLRGAFPGSLFFEYRALNQVNSQPTLADSLKFEATIFSGTSNLSRSGSKRVNLNKVVSDSTDPAAIRKQLDEIIKTIRYHLPNFGQRFYRAGADKNSLDVPDTAAAPHQTIYLNKIAANIRDYIDTDSQPTVVNNDAGYTVRLGTAPTHPFTAMGGGTAGANEVVAIGKERVPMMQEYAFRVREIIFGPRLGTSADYKISIDHYIEFWNTSNRDILLSDLGPNPFLLIANQPGWNAGTLDNIPEGAPRDIHLPLKNATRASDHTALTSFPAGSVTVITTDPILLPALTPDPTHVYYIPITPDNGVTGLRTYTGKTNLKSGSNLRLNIITRTTSSTDYETEIAIGNDLGILESAWGGGIINAALSVNIDGPENRLDDTKYHFRGGSLRGNSTGSNATTGDPRTNAEQMRFDLNGAAANNDKTRYFQSSLNDNNIPANSTLGGPNSNFVDPTKWFDYSSSSQSAGAAPGVIADANLTSIGQLGDIFDPVRTKGDSGDITLSRSGGRTLKIGQAEYYDATANPGGLWDGNSNSTSREWTAWRLADVFSATDLVQLDGRINVNGTNRDNGAALKAALYGYNFRASPDCDPSIAGTALSDPAIQMLVDQLKARIRNDGSTYAQFASTSGPLLERGEVSEMPVFNSGTALSGTNMANVFDRGREELFRRLVDLTTSRGNIFTVYAAGQSLIPQPGTAAPIVTSTSQIKVTFRIDPVWNAGNPTDPFDPTTNTRFQKPDRYAIKILYAGG